MGCFVTLGGGIGHPNSAPRAHSLKTWYFAMDTRANPTNVKCKI